MIAFTITCFILSTLFFIFLNSKYLYLIENIYGIENSKKIILMGRKIIYLSFIVFLFLMLFSITDKVVKSYFIPVAKVDSFDAFETMDVSKPLLQGIELSKVPQANLYQLSFVSKNGNYDFRAFLAVKDVLELQNTINEEVQKEVPEGEKTLDAFLIIWKILYCPCNVWSYKN
jgi:hypothetical protein